MWTHKGQLKGVLSWLVRWACRSGTRDFCSALAALNDPVKNRFFLSVHYFTSFVPIHEAEGMGPLEYQVMPSLSDVAHDG
jgi:hypothetical protein